MTSVRERVSRRGNKFLTFTFEDFSDSTEISLFGEQYERCRGHIRVDEMLYVLAAFQPRRYDPSEFELRIQEIRIMSPELFEGMVKHVGVELYNQDIDASLIKSLQDLLKQHPGEKILRFKIKDDQFAADIPMVAGDWRISPNGD